jgi:ATP/maltotriose-dependent transcriptional regulator MalT
MLSGLAESVAAELLTPLRHEGFYGEPLSEAELRVLSLLVAGRSVSEVETHRRTFYRKLGVTNRQQAIARAAELGLT